jgi:outer membrane protein TolC
MVRVYRGGSVGILLGVSAAFTSAAGAQPRPPAPAPVPPPAAAPAPAQPETPVPDELLRATPNGLTAEQVGQRASATSYTAKAAEETLRGAAARVDEAWAAFLPRLTATARYTRLSNFTPPSFGTGSVVVTPAPASDTPLPAGTPLLAQSFSFPLVLDNYLLQANITVPISDYLLRVDQNYTAATNSQEAARYDLVTQRATSAANGKIAYYTWLRARGAIVVAVETLNDQKTHLRDAQNQFAVGNASKADVLRAQTAVASAELALERAKNLADLTEKQVKVAMHAPDSETIAPGENLTTALPEVVGNAQQGTAEAFAARPEIKSIDLNAEAARQQARYASAGKFPTISAFGDAIYANPNPRLVPATPTWFATWDLGAQLVWSPNDTIVAGGAVTDAESRAAALLAQKGTTRDNIEIEVVQAYQAVREADFSLGTTERELASALEAYRVARELFNNGKGTSTTLTDAETDLTRARLDALNAQADARIARVRLEHALGRDAR